jgi:formylglycine-generating enzyme required for sulfatase activity
MREQFTGKCHVRVAATDNTAPSGMALIPGGEFTMGDTFNEGSSDERPTHTVDVSAFYMDRTEVTLARWREVRDWGISRGYTFDNEGLGKGLTHPVHTVSWYDAVKWCNARSRKENIAPAYYTDAGLTQEYKTGQAAPYVSWNTGYRLPTEAEWEKAARGGFSGKRFPWGDTISHSQANYCSSSDYVYDQSGSREVHPHPSYRTGGLPLSNPVGAFPWNGYELHDMAGNVWEWCWDWYGLYSSGSQTNPRGSGSGSGRVIRGGSWGSYAKGCQVSLRIGVVPSGKGNSMGFRSVLPPGR